MPHLDDTSAEALAVMTELYRRMSPREKLERVRQLSLAAHRLALAGLEARHPGESNVQLLLRLARIRLGDPIVRRVYGEPVR